MSKRAYNNVPWIINNAKSNKKFIMNFQNKINISKILSCDKGL